MTYEENVQHIAEEMAREAYDTAVKTGVINVKEPFNDFKYSKDWIKTHLTFARIAVRLQSEAVKDALTIVFIQQCGYNDAFTKQLIDSHLIERGLIPAPEAKPVMVKEVTKCPYCGSSPLLYERGVCEDCGQPDYELE